MERSGYLLEKARQCRGLARSATGARAVAILISTAESYEAQAGSEMRAEEAALSGLRSKQAIAGPADPSSAPGER